MAAYEVFAIRCGSRGGLTRGDYYLRFPTYGEPDLQMTMDYFFWVLRSPDETILVDTGWDPEVAARRGRMPHISPAEAMERLGVRPDTVSRVVGNVGRFPDAELVVQERELDFWGSPMGKRLQFAAHAEQSDIEQVLQADRDGRVTRLRGDAQLSPGLEARLVGGHSPGQTILLAETASGPVVLASDAIHYYEEMERDWPCSLLVDVAETYAGYDLLRELEAGGRRIIAGHDPLVMERFPRLDGELGEHVVFVR
jgi:glyoxylase-like metal-dependent hydrolase (beta-lactamase superfamily II)